MKSKERLSEVGVMHLAAAIVSHKTPSAKSTVPSSSHSEERASGADVAFPSKAPASSPPVPSDWYPTIMAGMPIVAKMIGKIK